LLPARAVDGAQLAEALGMGQPFAQIVIGDAGRGVAVIVHGVFRPSDSRAYNAVGASFSIHRRPRGRHSAASTFVTPRAHSRRSNRRERVVGSAPAQ
jgi:hypothetical protein